jgi:hypothetical protein
MTLDDLNLDDVDLSDVGPVDHDKRDQRVAVLLSLKGIAAVDAWRRKQEDLPSRSAAIRRLAMRGLKARGDESR